MSRMKKLLLGGLAVLAQLAIGLAADKPNEFLGAEYGDYNTGKGRAIAAAGKDAAVISLAGEWRCALDPDKKGVAALRVDKPIRLPGTLDEAGYGLPENLGLRALSRRFSYIGPAWYQRDVIVPADWAGKHVTMTFERVMWESRVWIDDKPIGTRDSLCTPHNYDLTGKLTPGTHRLTVRVDNTGRPGASCHGYGDDEQIRWNGLLGKLELRAQDAVFIRSAQVYPDLARKRALVRVELGNITGESCDGTIKVSVRDIVASANFKIAGETLPVEVAVPLGEKPALWDEFTPNLHEADITVAAEAGGQKTFDRTAVTFGLRELGHRGTQLTMNGRTLFLRGTHDGGGFPLTGHPATDVESWRKIFRTCKDYGLNHVRYHSFCPPEAAFTAADGEGIILLAELPYWGHVGANWAGTPFLRAELRRILDAYGNHPSFAMMSMGNEHSGDWDVLAGFVAEGKRHDPRHLYAAASNEYIRMGKDPRPVNDGDEFAVIMKGPQSEPGYELGRIRMMERLLNGESPDFAADYRDILKPFDVPVFAHELGQYWIFPDLSESAKYTGVLRSSALKLFRDSLGAAGLLDRAEKFHQASGALAVQLYKEDIERELRTPGLGGFQLLDLHDYTGQNTSLVGLLDAFWESKGIVTPTEFRRFCAPVVVLSRMAKRLWTSDETLQAELEIANYGPADLINVTPVWKLIAQDGRVVASGTLANRPRIPIGENTSLGRLEVTLREIAVPAQLRLEAVVGPATNDWTLWVYPKSLAAPANIRITEKLDGDTLQFVENGGRVLFLGHGSAHTVPVDFPNPIWNPFGFGIQSCGLLIAAQHPALAEFPTAMHADWQWRDLLEPEARAFVLNDLPHDATPIVEVIDQPLRAYRLGAVLEARIGRGALLATSLELDAGVAGRQLRRSLMDYLASDRCQPALQMSADDAKRLLIGNRFQFAGPVTGEPVMLDVEASVTAPAENATPWKRVYDRVVKCEAGFDYELPGRDPATWKKNGHPAWMARQFTVRLRCPANFTGTLYLQFRDSDSGKAVAALQSGRDAMYVGPHGGEGKWVALRVTPADLKDGALEVTAFKPAGGDSWSRSPRITRLVVAQGGASTSHMRSSLGMATLQLPLNPAVPEPAGAWAGPLDRHGELVVSICTKGQFAPPTDLKGMRALAGTAHRYGFPVTWIVKPFTVREAAAELREWHDRFGDEVAWFSEGTPLDKAEAELKEMRALVTWQKVVSSGNTKYDQAWATRYERLGIESVWGRCYEQTDADHICDRGSPHGFYYLRPGNYKAPRVDPGGVVSVPWLSNDPNLVFWSGFQSSFTFDPDDPIIMGFLGAGRTEYWLALVDQFRNQTRYNKVVPLIVQQEYSSPMLQQSLKPMDELFAYVKEKGIKVVPLTEAVSRYKEAAGPVTPPTYGVYESLGGLDIVRNPLPGRHFTLELVSQPLASTDQGAPFNGYYTTRWDKPAGKRFYFHPEGKKFYEHGKLFVYYDRNGLLLFDEGTAKPVRISSYLEIPDGKTGFAVLPEMSHFFDTAKFIPEVEIKREESGRALTIRIAIEPFRANPAATKRLPYGVMVWGDFSAYRLPAGVPEGAAIVGDQGLFVPFVLQVDIPVQWAVTLRKE